MIFLQKNSKILPQEMPDKYEVHLKKISIYFKIILFSILKNTFFYFMIKTISLKYLRPDGSARPIRVLLF